MIKIGVSYPTRRVLINRPGTKGKPLKFKIRYISHLAVSGFVDKCTYVVKPEDNKQRKKEAAEDKGVGVDELTDWVDLDKYTDWAEVDKLSIDHIIVEWDKKQIGDKNGKPAELNIDNKVGFAQTVVDVMAQLRELAENEVTFKDCSTELLVKNSNGQSYLSSDGPAKMIQ